MNLTCTQEWEVIVRLYTDCGMSREQAERQATRDMQRAMR